MNIKRSVILIFVFAVALLSCKKSGIDHWVEYEKSYRTWMQFKKVSGNSYRYRIVSSSWTGLGSQLEITVRNGKPVQRHFKILISPGYQGSVPDVMEWVENEGAINSHENYKDFPITLDQVYETARTKWLLRRDNGWTYFEAKNHGLISLCGYSPSVCADDCFTGITIDFIEKL